MDDLALAQRRHVDDGAQAAADQALDFLGAAGLLAGRRFAPHAVMGGARQHAVFRRHPALAGAAQETRGVPSSRLAVHSTWVSPNLTRQEPSACLATAGFKGHGTHLVVCARLGAWWFALKFGGAAVT